MRRISTGTLTCGLTLLIAILIAALTLLPMPQVGIAAPGSDKLHHFLAFLALALPGSFYRPATALWLIPMTMLFGGAIEVLQPLVGRHLAAGDFLADAMGALLGAGIGAVLHLLVARPLRRRLA